MLCVPMRLVAGGHMVLVILRAVALSVVFTAVLLSVFVSSGVGSAHLGLSMPAQIAAGAIGALTMFGIVWSTHRRTRGHYDELMPWFNGALLGWCLATALAAIYRFGRIPSLEEASRYVLV
jgi:hypothetical protein